MTRAAWVTIAIVTLVTAGLADSWATAWLGFAMLGIVIYATLAFRQPARLVDASRRVSTSIAAPGGELSVHVSLAWEGMRVAGWVLARDYLPDALVPLDPPGRLFVSGGSQQLALAYRVRTTRRGFYPIGPMSVACGDFFGVIRAESKRERLDFVTVSPRVHAIPRVRLPSNRPIGSVNSPNRAFEDPTRLGGVREYVPGDSFRRIHWRTTARAGWIASKVLEPSCSTEVNLLLNLYQGDWPDDETVDLACVTTASLATSLLADNQAVGLATNGWDARWKHFPPEDGRQTPAPIRPDRNPAQLDSMLALLGRLGPSSEVPLHAYLTALHSRLPWSATLVVVTHGLDETSAEALRELRRSGFNLAAVIAGVGDATVYSLRRVAALRLPYAWIREEEELATLDFRTAQRR